ncbi:alpha/beta hydrolase [Micropruina sonneratiae]|uniref:alpha/beta hydrolase n=1 Tax=Micropruina sonneratiae TaxID=2986940 RepID=UPI0022266550|nr:alpha/beta fold hydrolase [Micropruina sp. KQZ13P-5]MCW3156571.1 alpha/beta fold hydrolase [Micropruina sp. KQZ13P-5]
MTMMPGAEPISVDGSSTGVLLCHGYPSTPQSMRGWAEHLAAAGYTVRVPLLPGMGTDWRDLNATGWQDWYGEVAAAHDELSRRCERVFAGGLSMGGLLATKLAQDHPGLAGLILVNPVFAHTNPALRVLPLLQHLIPSLGGIAGDIKKPGVVELAYDRNPLKSMYSQTRLWRIVVEDLPQLRLPVLLFTSREDHVVPAMSWQLFLDRAGSGDVTHVMLEDSYHVATLDNDAELIFGESVEFIERVGG